MKILEKINISSASKLYIIGMIYAVVALFVALAVIFLYIIADKLTIVMNQPAGVTYTYFVAFVDRILAILTLFVILPLTCYQVFAKAISKTDKTVSVVGIIVLLAIAFVWGGGEYHFLKKYQDGDLSSSKMFCNPTIEAKIFDRIIEHNGGTIPQMCQLDKSK